MIRISGLALLSILVLAGPAWAQTHPAHQHGVAALDVSVGGAGFEADLDGPLANFISFEHSPGTESERAEVAEMAGKLAKAEDIFKASAEAGCKLKSMGLKSENIPADLFGPLAAADGDGEDRHHDDEAGGHDDHDHQAEEAGHDHGEGHGEDLDQAEHADLEASYVFECAAPDKLTGLEIGLFDVFPYLEEVEARVVSDKGQSASELKAGAAGLKW
jgi:hypothetical protein